MIAPLLRSIGCILDLPAQVHAATLRLRRLGASGAAGALDELALASRSGHPTDDAALLACALALIEEDDTWRDAIHAAAVRIGAMVAAAMLARGLPPHKRMSRHGRLPDTDMLEHARVPRQWRLVEWSRTRLKPDRNFWDEDARELAPEPTVEVHVFTLKRTHPWVRRRVEQLGRHPSAIVIHRLLRSSACTPKDAVRVAARRPVTDALVRELTSHRPTIAMTGVRIALAANPFTPSRVALLLTPACRPQLRTLTRSNVLPEVRALAAQLSGGSFSDAVLHG